MCLKPHMFMFALLTTLCFANVASASHVHTGKIGPVLWRKSQTPVAVGFNSISLMVSLVSPCELILNTTSDPHLYEKARRKCETIYNEYFIDEMEIMCPRKTWVQVEKREKRGIGIFMCLLATVVTPVGIGTFGSRSTMVDNGQVRGLEAAQAELVTKLDALEKQLREDKSLIHRLTCELETAVNQMKNLEDDLNKFKSQSVDLNYAISFIMSRLMIGRSIVKDTARNMRVGKLTGSFFDFMNFTLPCNLSCPIQYAVTRGCRMSDERDKVFMDFLAPTVSEELTVVEADAFNLMLRNGHQTCRAVYFGPKNAIVSEEEDCIYGTDVSSYSRNNIIVSPFSGCKGPTANHKDGRNFRVLSCEKQLPGDHQDFVQIKVFENSYVVYCPYSVYSVGKGAPKPCPMDPFLIPLAASFKVNDKEFEGTNLDLIHLEKVDPMLKVRVEAHLPTHANMTVLLDSILEPQQLTGERDMEGFHFSLLGLVGSVVLMVFVFGVCILCRRRIIYTTTTEARREPNVEIELLRE